MSVSDFLIDYYKSIKLPEGLPSGVDILNPFQEEDVRKVLEEFYKAFYASNQKRIFLIGINPGRKGAGITGIPFTDPIHLENLLGINNVFDKKHELSSIFIYEMIKELGGAKFFYDNFHFSSVSPVGFVKDGKNLNYYDIPDFKVKLEEYMVREMSIQVSNIGRRDIAFSLGKGKNIQYLKELNQQHKWFDEIEPLPHPRWVMQYRLKSKAMILEQVKKQLLSKI